MRKNKTKKENRQQTLVIISFILGALVMLLVLKSISLFTNNNILESTSLGTKSFNDAIEKVYDATVFIETYTGSLKSSTGSGFFYKKDSKYAYVLTNEHVLEGDTIEITNSNDEKVEGKLLGKDAYLDLAVIRVDKKYAPKIPNIGNSNKSRIGDAIFAIGSPLGENYQGSVTAGIISGKNRMVQTTVTTTQQDNTWLMSVIQIDAAINPGSSGGPLINTNGEVIGVVTMKLIKEEIEAMSFAIPIEDVMSKIENLEKGKEIKWPEIGISMVNVSSANYNEIEIPKEVKDGVLILSVKEDSSAEEAKLKRGDIIIKVNDVKVKNTAYLKYELFKYKIGENVNITYLRDGKEKTSSVKLSSSNS